MSKRIIVGVLGLAVNDEGKFLLTVRNEPKYPDIHKSWQIPGGGMDFGETPEETMFREIREEVGVEAVIIHDEPILHTHTWTDTQSHLLLLCYLIEIGSQTVLVDGDETLDFGWFDGASIGGLKSLPGTEIFIQRAQKILIQK